MQKDNLRILHLAFFIIIIGLISVKKTPKNSLLIMSSQRSRLTLKNETKFLLSFNESKSRLENFIRFVIISKHVKFVEHFLQYLAAKNKSIFGS